MKHAVDIKDGAKRIRLKDMKECCKKGSRWIPKGNMSPNTRNVIDIYMKKNNVYFLIDDKNNDFLKGYLNSDGIVCGERVSVLPNGKKLARGAF